MALEELHEHSAISTQHSANGKFSALDGEPEKLPKLLPHCGTKIAKSENPA